MYEHRIKWALVMENLHQATHCHGCGRMTPVCLSGYIGEYCTKSCWRKHDYTCFFAEDCMRCSGTRTSFANSMYHHVWRSDCSQNGYYWPMKSCKTPCTNICIITTRPIKCL